MQFSQGLFFAISDEIFVQNNSDLDFSLFYSWGGGGGGLHMS